MEQSKHSQEILKLGKRIISELKQERHNDFLGNWMAFYIAEKIVLFENEEDEVKKAKIEKEISVLILKVWDKRKYRYENLNPLNELKQALELLEILSRKQNEFLGIKSKTITNSHLSEFASTVNDASFKILKISLLLSLLPDKIIKANDWINDGETILSQEEKDIIENLNNFIDDFDITKKIFINVGELENADEKNDVNYLEDALQKIKDLLLEQNEAFKLLETKLKKG